MGGGSELLFIPLKIIAMMVSDCSTGNRIQYVETESHCANARYQKQPCKTKMLWKCFGYRWLDAKWHCSIKIEIYRDGLGIDEEIAWGTSLAMQRVVSLEHYVAL